MKAIAGLFLDSDSNEVVLGIIDIGVAISCLACASKIFSLGIA